MPAAHILRIPCTVYTAHVSIYVVLKSAQEPVKPEFHGSSFLAASYNTSDTPDFLVTCQVSDIPVTFAMSMLRENCSHVAFRLYERKTT